MRVDAREIHAAIGESSIGLVLVAQSENGVRAVMLGGDRDELRSELRDRFPGATLISGDAKLDALVAKVIDFIESPRGVGFNVPLDMCGSEFQRSVWQALREIPAGKTASYADIANRIGRPNAVRAVGAACAANHLAVVV
ncbi:MAG: methylated-DNA--[protein]-cysteine S-methyltransferase, partial [Gemmatimonadaceae bacterium]